MECCRPICSVSPKHVIEHWSSGCSAEYYNVKELFDFINAKFPIENSTILEFLRAATKLPIASNQMKRAKKDLEDQIPKGSEMKGMSVVLAGMKELGMTQEALTSLIKSHGGEVQSEADENTHFMIAPQSEVSKKIRSKKVQMTLDQQIPIFTLEYLLNLCGRKKDWTSLRTDKKVAAKYLVKGSTMGERNLCERNSENNEEVNDTDLTSPDGQFVLLTEKTMYNLYKNWEKEAYENCGENLVEHPSSYMTTDYEKYAQQRNVIVAIRRNEIEGVSFYHKRMKESNAYDSGAHAIAASILNRCCNAKCALKYAQRKREEKLFDGNDLYFSYMEDSYSVEVTKLEYCQFLNEGFRWETSCFVAQ